jgi:hypothetical protein
MNLDCSFDPNQVVTSERDPKRYARVQKIELMSSRIDMLEGQMTDVNSKLDGIASMLATLSSQMPQRRQVESPSKSQQIQPLNQSRSCLAVFSSDLSPRSP